MSGIERLLEVPEHRRERLGEISARLRAAKRLVLTTHVNADGDGVGSQAALSAWLAAEGIRPVIVNPTDFPDRYRWLVPEGVAVAGWKTGEGKEQLSRADLFMVLDTSERERVGALAKWMPPEKTVVIDHHVPSDQEPLGHLALQDQDASATGELVFDLLETAGAAWSPELVTGVYAALVADTGSFRYGNTTPRCHAIAAALIRRGARPEPVYQGIFGNTPRKRLDLLREALGCLENDSELGLTWMVVTEEMVKRAGASSDDFESLIEHVRTLEGTEVALLFRGVGGGQTKVSFRSSGAADVLELARRYGGGGHAKAAGALVKHPPERAVPEVVEAARQLLLARS
ncbi:MAG: DHH family phosphoesterase [Longimicrobiaceae bacterium]